MFTLPYNSGSAHQCDPLTPMLKVSHRVHSQVFVFFSRPRYLNFLKLPEVVLNFKSNLVRKESNPKFRFKIMADPVSGTSNQQSTVNTFVLFYMRQIRVNVVHTHLTCRRAMYTRQSLRDCSSIT